MTSEPSTFEYLHSVFQKVSKKCLTVPKANSAIILACPDNIWKKDMNSCYLLVEEDLQYFSGEI